MSKKPVKQSDQKKAWFLKTSYNKPYAIDTLPKKRAILIVCEGLNTEAKYFEAIPAPNIDVKVVGGCGSKTALIKKALRLSQKELYKGRAIWCVYDLDFKGDEIGQKEDFNNSIVMAESNGIKVAYSNDAFELWLVLHYKHVEQALLRGLYYEMLSELWGVDYVQEGKKLNFCKGLYDRLMQDERADQMLAIKRAKTLLDAHQHKPYAERNPCTTVFELIELLIANE
jgi:RloB-like protein